MEGCPANHTLLYLILSALIIPYLFLMGAVVREIYRTLRTVKKQSSRRGSITSAGYAELQLELFGEKALKNLKHIRSSSEVKLI